MDQTQEHADSRRDPGIAAIYLLYGAFFVVWCCALAIGELWPGDSQPLLLGMPAWFFIGCLFSFFSVSIALIICVRRYFQ